MGEQGFEKLTVVPDIMLLDVNMPRVNGIELLQKIRNNETLRAASVFMLTTSDDERDIVAAYDLNVAGYIVKPMDMEAFFRAMSILDMYWSLQRFPK